MKKQVLFFVLGLSACGQKNPAPQEQVPFAETVTENIYTPQTSATIPQTTQTDAQFPYDIDEWVEQELKYPEEIKHLRIDTVIHANFIVETNGMTTYIGVTEIAHRALCEEAERIVNEMPIWTPATKNGKPIQSTQSIALSFKLPVKLHRSIGSEETSAEREMHQYQNDQLKSPSFKGDLNAWIRQNIQYSQDMILRRIKGVVYVKFTVTIDGTLQNIQLARKNDADMDAEALRLVQSMPAWNPAYENGKPIERPYIIGIYFARHE